MADKGYNFESLKEQFGEHIFDKDDPLGLKARAGLKEPASIKDIAGRSELAALREQNAALKEENERLRNTILRCPKCQTKLRLPRK